MIRIDTFDLSDEARVIFEKAREVSDWIRLHIGCLEAGFQKEDAYLRAVLLYLNCIRISPIGLKEMHELEEELNPRLLEELIQYLKENVLSIPSDIDKKVVSKYQENKPLPTVTPSQSNTLYISILYVCS